MKKHLPVPATNPKPPKELVEKVARQLCKEAGENPDEVIVWEGEYGYGDYPFSKWQRYVGPAKKQIAAGEANV